MYKQLSQTKTDLYYRVWFKIVRRAKNQVYIPKLRTSTGTSILGLYVGSNGVLGYRNDVIGEQFTESLRSHRVFSARRQSNVQLNENSSGRTYDFAFDDFAAEVSLTHAVWCVPSIWSAVAEYAWLSGVHALAGSAGRPGGRVRAGGCGK